MSILQWAFLALAIGAAIAELHFGTIYLAGLALAALLTVGAGFVFGDTPDIVVFLAACAGVIVAVPAIRRRFGGRRPADLDIGQTVVLIAPGRHPGEAIVDYRGARWEADIDPATPVRAGAPGRITARQGNRLAVAILAAPDNPGNP